MPLFQSATPKRAVTKSYGRDGLIALVNPLLTLIMRAFGVQPRLRPEERVVAEMERDAAAMIRAGYRIASQEQFEMPPFEVTWYRVTYELADGAGTRASGRPGS